MYTDYFHQGRTLPDWQKDLRNEYTLGELYRMAKEGCDFNRLALEQRKIISER